MKKNEEQNNDEPMSMHTHFAGEEVCEICVIDAQIHLAFVKRKLALQEAKR